MPSFDAFSSDVAVRNPSQSYKYDDYESKKPSIFSLRAYRLVIGVMLLFTFYCTTSMRADLGMAMVCMVNASAYSSPETSLKPDLNQSSTRTSQCERMETEKAIASGYNGTLAWNPTMQATLFSATYYGAILTVVPGGILADRFMPNIILLVAVLNYVLISFLTPLLATTNYYGFLTGRIVMGLGEGFVLPTMSSLAARWFPETERSTICAIYTSGNQIATSTVPLIGAALCSSKFLGGWPAIFYLLGCVGTIWACLWVVFVTSSPQDNKWIPNKEKRYLEVSLGKTGKKLAKDPIPWKSIALSLVMLSNWLSTYAANYTATLQQAYLPTYYKEVLYMDIHKNGFYSTMPFLVQLIMKNIFSILSDKLKAWKVVSPTFACKMFQTLGAIVQSFTLLMLAFFIDCTRPTLAVVLFAMNGIGAAAVIPGSMTSLLSVAPTHTGTLIALSMIFGQLANFSATNIVGIINKHGSPEEWSLIFLIAGIINITSGVLFVCFGSADVQPWATPLPRIANNASNQGNELNNATICDENA
ncbi:hypothetical protein AB6A40_004067 [Gnathostoma spinigerum]|uniref:Major facilitator superfamily (MFS) profile domain-containing protein n=1 Tax=Gnathostoma spinigerum TaxID=75299 RepID=A0ABD6EBJ5_9BILA